MPASTANCEISTDRSRLDSKAIHAFLSTSYWSRGIPLATLERALENSICFGVYDGTKQVGFARLITDKATFAYLADVYVLEEYRGQGLARKLLTAVQQHPDAQGLRRTVLVTRDAHGLYRGSGFSPLAAPERWMERHDANVYEAR